MLEVANVHPKSYGMVKHKAGVIITTYKEAPIDWGYIIGVALQAGLIALQVGKKIISIIAQYLTALFLPVTSLPPPNPVSQAAM